MENRIFEVENSKETLAIQATPLEATSTSVTTTKKSCVEPSAIAAIENQNSKFKNPARRQLQGRVARLPRDIRRQINEMLDDHVPFAEIITRLGDHGKDLTVKCIQGWKARGYEDYKTQQRLLDQYRARTERAFELALNASAVHGFQATQQIASAQILEIITELGTDVLRQAVLTNPMHYFRMLSAFTRISNSGLRCERHLADESERHAKLAASAVATASSAEPKKGLSQTTLQTLNHDLNLM